MIVGRNARSSPHDRTSMLPDGRDHMSTTLTSAAVVARLPHRMPPIVRVPAWRVEAPAERLDDGALVSVAARAARSLPTVAFDAVMGFADHPDRSGALLLRGIDVGHLPPTPPAPTGATGKDQATELSLLAIARLLGHPVGYLPEHGGRVVQDIVPTRAGADQQVSTSSKVELMFHTETAFHPHRPRYLLLLCLRGDPAAVTTLASVHEIVDRLPAHVVDALAEPRFRTAVDASFLAGRANVLGPARPILSGTRDEPTFVFDADLMVGVDDEADRAVRLVADVVAEHHTGVVLEPGDLLVVDNHLAVHGRSPFTPRFDGTDRWLQRTFVVADLAASAADRTGRVITTTFGDPA
jgi:L-asparagine oxygenase